MHGASEGIASLNSYRLLAEHACGTSFWFESYTRDARHSGAVTVLLFEGTVRDNGPVTAGVTGSAMARVSQQCHEPGGGMAWTFARVGTGGTAQLGCRRRHQSEDRRQMAAGCATALCLDGSLGANRAGPIAVLWVSIGMS